MSLPKQPSEALMLTAKCEGCGVEKEVKARLPRQKYAGLPDVGWVGCGRSRYPESKHAMWCPTCAEAKWPGSAGDD